MSVKFEFCISDENYDRLFAVKEDTGNNDLSGNEFAKVLLEKELRRMHPETVKFNKYGERIKNRE